MVRDNDGSQSADVFPDATVWVRLVLSLGNGVERRNTGSYLSRRDPVYNTAGHRAYHIYIIPQVITVAALYDGRITESQASCKILLIKYTDNRVRNPHAGGMSRGRSGLGSGLNI